MYGESVYAGMSVISNLIARINMCKEKENENANDHSSRNNVGGLFRR